MNPTTRTTRSDPPPAARGSATRRATAATVLLAGLLGAGAAAAQTVIVIQGASVTEGASGTRILSLPVSFVGANTSTVNGFVSAIPDTTNAFPATGGTTCGTAGVDFEQFTNVPFSIPPNTPNGTLTVNVRICSDTAGEPDERIFVSLSNVTGGAACTADSCGARGIIVNDDGAPVMRISGVTVSEPSIVGLAAPARFVVTQSYRAATSSTANFTTRNGSAVAGFDYRAVSGTLTIAAGSDRTFIDVPVLGDPISPREGTETFTVELSNPANATIGTAVGQGSILNTASSVGVFSATPSEAAVLPGEAVEYAVDWAVPPGRVWRDLRSLDLRLRRGSEVAIWVRWTEADNRLALCESIVPGEGIGLGSHRSPQGVRCAAGELPGTPGVLLTERARLDLAGSRLVGSGPTGQGARLTLPLSFAADAAGSPLTVELAASDDFGNEDGFVRIGELHVAGTGR